jgi:hypothetical protein
MKRLRRGRLDGKRTREIVLVGEAVGWAVCLLINLVTDNQVYQFGFQVDKHARSPKVLVSKWVTESATTCFLTFHCQTPPPKPPGFAALILGLGGVFPFL